MNRSTIYKKLTNKKYTIGYKFILNLFVSFVGLISFCSAGSYTYEGTVNGNIVLPVPQSYISKDFSLRCVFYCSWNGSSRFTLNTSYYFGESYQATNKQIVTQSYDCKTNYVYDYDFSSFTAVPYTPIGIATVYFNNITNYETINYSCTFSGDNIISAGGVCPECPICPSQYTSEECQSVYGLVSSGLLNTCENNYNNCQSDLNTCQNNTTGFNDLLNNCSNNLNACNNSLTNCLQQNCPETTTGINRSSLFINNIQYPGGPTIKFTIPEEIERDQYTDEEETNIDVIGYGYDQNKMQQMVNTQYYKPTSEEMNQLIGKIADFLPLIAVALLIIRIRRVIKKVFRF